MEKEYKTLAQFYPYYLTEHSNDTCRTLHFIGTSLVILLLIAAAVTGKWWLCWFIPVAGYGFAWVGHFIYEKNKPATFQYPLYSLASDFIMYFELLIGKIPFNPQKQK
jgi:hypothetical protein